MQIRGTKRVTLHPSPTSALLEHAYSRGEALSFQEARNFLAPQSLAQDLMECTVSDGEMIFIPEGWFHDIWYETHNANLVIRLRSSDPGLAEETVSAALEGLARQRAQTR